MTRAARRFYLIFYALLLAFTAYVLLDAFVIERRYQAASLETEIDESIDMEPIWTDTSYLDGSLSVELASQRVSGTTVYVADVVLSDVSHMGTLFAQDTYGRNITERVADMASRCGAILAINGDYYGAQRSGYVLRGGTLYRSTARSASQEDLCLWPDGSMTIVREGDVNAESLLEQGALQVFSFGPALVIDGETAVDKGEEVGRAMASNPRTAIAMIEPLHYLFVVSDGRTRESEGLSLSELAAFLKEQGAQIAYNFDGGGSSTMVFGGKVVNYPTTNGKYSERAVSDIVYVK